MKMIRTLPFLFAIGFIVTPLAARAQQGGTMQGTFTISVGGNASAATPTEDSAVGPITADSLKTLKKFAKAHQPLVFVDDSISTVAKFDKLAFESVTSVKFQEGGEQELKFYGPKAKNGVLLVTTKKKGATTSAAPAAGSGGGSFILIQKQ